MCTHTHRSSAHSHSAHKCSSTSMQSTCSHAVCTCTCIAHYLHTCIACRHAHAWHTKCSAGARAVSTHMQAVRTYMHTSLHSNDLHTRIHYADLNAHKCSISARTCTAHTHKVCHAVQPNVLLVYAHMQCTHAHM